MLRPRIVVSLIIVVIVASLTVLVLSKPRSRQCQIILSQPGILNQFIAEAEQFSTSYDKSNKYFWSRSELPTNSIAATMLNVTSIKVVLLQDKYGVDFRLKDSRSREGLIVSPSEEVNDLSTVVKPGSYRPIAKRVFYYKYSDM